MQYIETKPLHNRHVKRFVDEYLFNNQYSFLINSISIIVHITNPHNTNLIYVIVIPAKDKIKFLSFRQV